MNHKRGRRKKARAGCLLCKPHKMNGASKEVLGKTGFGNIKRIKASKQAIKDEL